jgi:hypothetical protein
VYEDGKVAQEARCVRAVPGHHQAFGKSEIVGKLAQLLRVPHLRGNCGRIGAADHYESQSGPAPREDRGCPHEHVGPLDGVDRSGRSDDLAARSHPERLELGLSPPPFFDRDALELCANTNDHARPDGATASDRGVEWQ